MADVLLFAEDDAQERFVGTLVRRIARECEVPADLRVRSTHGGYGSVLKELARFTRACGQGSETMPDVVVVAVDANCRGINERREEVQHHAGQILRDRLVLAVADPHVERWFLVDGAAFRVVLGRGCDAPDQKCEKDRYKQLLIRAVQGAGVEPLLGGIEYAEDLVEQMDLERAAGADDALGGFIEALQDKFNLMKR